MNTSRRPRGFRKIGCLLIILLCAILLIINCFREVTHKESEIIANLQSDDHIARRVAAATLSEYRTSNAVAALFTTFMTDKDGYVRGVACSSLKKIGEPARIYAIEKLSDKMTATTAIEFLSDQEGEDVTAALKKCLSAPNLWLKAADVLRERDRLHVHDFRTRQSQLANDKGLGIARILIQENYGVAERYRYPYGPLIETVLGYFGIECPHKIASETPTFLVLEVWVKGQPIGEDYIPSRPWYNPISKYPEKYYTGAKVEMSSMITMRDRKRRSWNKSASVEPTKSLLSIQHSDYISAIGQRVGDPNAAPFRQCLQLEDFWEFVLRAVADAAVAEGIDPADPLKYCCVYGVMRDRKSIYYYDNDDYNDKELRAAAQRVLCNAHVEK